MLNRKSNRYETSIRLVTFRLDKTLGDERLCPVLFSLPLGFLVVMPRCEPVNREYWEVRNGPYDWDAFWLGDDDEEIKLTDMVEDKWDSLGILNGRLVAVDYGSWK